MISQTYVNFDILDYVVPTLLKGQDYAFFAKLVFIIFLAIVAILNFDSSMNMILNPLCFNIDIIQSVEIALAKILSELVYLAILSIGITLYICRTDIF